VTSTPDPTARPDPEADVPEAPRPAGTRPSTPARQVLRLAVPALGALIAEPLFLLADSAIVGRLGTAPLAGLGIAGAVLSTAVNLFVFLAYGTTASVARRVGAGDQPGAVEQGLDGMWLAAGLGVLTAVLGWLAAPALAGLFGGGPEVTAQAVTYLRWSMPGLPGMLVVLAGTGVLRGLQDTRTPLAVAAAGAAVNALLNLVLVHGLPTGVAGLPQWSGLGIAGSGLGTALTQLGMAVAFGLVVGGGARRLGASLRPNPAGIQAFGRAGVPLLVRTLSLRVALLVTTWVATSKGSPALAAHQVVFTIWTLLALGLDALAIAAQALTGRALGAGDVAGVRAATALMVRWGVAGGAVVGLIVFALRDAAGPLFSADPQVRTAIAATLVVVALGEPLAGYVFVLDGVLIGAGDGRYLAVAGVIQVLAYAPAAWAVQAWGPGGTAGLVWLWVSFSGGYLLARALFLGLRARGTAWLITGAA